MQHYAGTGTSSQAYRLRIGHTDRRSLGRDWSMDIFRCISMQTY